MTSSNGNLFRVTSPLWGGFPHKGQWRGALTYFFYLRRNKRLSKQSSRRWSGTPYGSLWRQCNELGHRWIITSHRNITYTCPRLIFSFSLVKGVLVNSSLPGQNGCHLADDSFKCLSLDEKARISITFSLKFVPKGQINNISALVQIMAWRRPGDKPLSEPMLTPLTDAYVRPLGGDF